MAGTTQPIGPFPDGADPAEYDRLRRRVLWKMPYGLYLVGSRSGSRRNLMTLNWATQLSFDPKLVGVAVEAHALTHELIAEGGSFSLCLLNRADRAVIRKFVKPAEFDEQAHTLSGLEIFDGRSGVPILTQSAAWLECQVRERLPFGQHTFFVREVVGSGFGADEDVDILTMGDTRMSYGG